MKQQIIDLWKLSFGDSDDFIQLFFDRVYRDENTIVIQKNGTVVSTLQILPYEMTYCGTTIPAGYICGVCTLPSEQGKGFMTQLMFTALEEMRNRDFALAILIPASPQLFDVYRRFDFANAFDYSTEEIYFIDPAIEKGSKYENHLHANLRILSHQDLSPATIYTYYHSKQRTRDCCVQHSASQFETICKDWLLGKGEIWIAFSNEQPAGLAFTMLSTPENVSFREIMAENTEIKNALVQSVLNRHQLHKAILRLPPTPTYSIPYGMAKIINKEQMVELYQSFLMGGGQRSRFKVQGSNLPDFMNTSIPTLTQILLKYEQRQGFMNLMMD